MDKVPAKKEVKQPGRKISNMKIRLLIAVAILIAFLILSLGYYVFFYSKKCPDGSCFYQAMLDSKKATWIREDEKAVWLYNNIGSEGDVNLIKVQVLQLKQGKAELEPLQGETMTCRVLKGDTRAPESDITQCSGPLKEEIQEILIQRMHNYLLKNLGQIEDEFKSY